MLHHIIKILLALGLALSIYFIGAQGCAPVGFSPLNPLSCEEMTGVESCKARNIFNDLPDDSEEFNDKVPNDDSRANRKAGQKKGSPNSRRESGRSNKYQSDKYGDRYADREGSAKRPPPQPLCEMNYDVSLGEARIVFLMDISSSMAPEHRNIGSQLSPLFYDAKDVDYHVAVMTMDISSSPDNPVRNAYYQDGRFIPIGRQLFLRNENLGERPSQRVISDLKNAIEREETQRCDKRRRKVRSRGEYDALYNPQDSFQCPSHDERGIYALNLSIQNPKYREFWKPGRHYTIIPVSDEDNRSSSDYVDQYGYEDYEWEDMDYPENLLENFYNYLGKSATVSFYPIIIPPWDRKCLARQNEKSDRGEGTGRGYYGKTYARLARASDSSLTRYGNLLKGGVISICKKNYRSQLKQISVAAQTIRVPLSCGNPKKVELFVNNKRLKTNYRIEGKTLFMEPGTVKLNSRLKVRVICPGLCS